MSITKEFLPKHENIIVYQDDEMLECKTKTTEYRKKKNNVKRDKVFVPRKRRIYTVKKICYTKISHRENL